MHTLALRPTERKSFVALRRWHSTAPVDVVAQEARHRLGRRVLAAIEAGQTQPAIARDLGYSLSQIERIAAIARRDRNAGVVPPLDVWKTRASASPPTPDEATPDEVNVITIGVDTQPPMGSCAVAWTGTDGSKAWILRLDGNDLTLSGVPATPEPAPPTDADRYMFALVQDRGMLLGSAVRMLQLAAGIEATGAVDDDTLSLVAGLAAWSGMERGVASPVA